MNHRPKDLTHDKYEFSEAEKGKMSELKTYFTDLGIYCDNFYQWKVIVYVGKSLDNRIGWMVFHHDGLVTAGGPHTGDRYSTHVHTDIVAKNRKDWKILAVKDAAINDCMDITDEFGGIKPEMRHKFERDFENISKVVDETKSRIHDTVK